MQSVYDFLKEAQVYYLATIDGDQARVRPFGTVDIFDGKLYIQTGKVKNVYQQIIANPKVEISAMVGAESVRITGELVPDERIEAKAHMLDAYPQLRFMYDENDDNTIVLYFQNAVAKFETLGNPEATRFVEF